MNSVLWVLKPFLFHKSRLKREGNGYAAYGPSLYLFAMENLKILPWTIVNVKDSVDSNLPDVF